MLIPEGLTEEEVIAIISKVANEKKKTYRFGYHGEEDIYQQCFVHCISVLNNNKFVPRGPKPIATQLLNFLRVHTRNKLSNDIRKTMYRYAQPDNVYNTVKWNLMHTLKIYSQNLRNNEMFAVEYSTDEKLDRESLMEKLRDRLTVHEFRNLLRWMEDDTKLSKPVREKLFDRVRHVLGEQYYEENK